MIHGSRRQVRSCRRLFLPTVSQLYLVYELLKSGFSSSNLSVSSSPHYAAGLVWDFPPPLFVLCTSLIPAGQEKL